MKYLFVLGWLASFMAMTWFLYVPQHIPLMEWIAALGSYGVSVHFLLLLSKRIKHG